MIDEEVAANRRIGQALRFLDKEEEEEEAELEEIDELMCEEIIEPILEETIEGDNEPLKKKSRITFGENSFYEYNDLSSFNWSDIKEIGLLLEEDEDDSSGEEEEEEEEIVEEYNGEMGDEIYEADENNRQSFVYDNILLSQLNLILVQEKNNYETLEDSVEFYPGSDLTKQDAISLIDGSFNLVGLNSKDAVIILSLLYQLLPPNSQLPIHFTSNNGRLVNDIDKYTRRYSHVFGYDCCPCGDFVYVGKMNSLLDRCPSTKSEAIPGSRRKRNVICGKYRWTTCKYCKKDERCDHFAYRVPQFQLQYRPILFVIMELLKQGEGFLRLLNYIHVDDMKQYSRYSDVMDSNVVSKQLDEMKTKFLGKYSEWDEIIMVNIVIDLNYDGAQVYKRKTSHFNPLLMSILNIPPIYRKEIGVGMFILSLFTLPAGTLIFLLSIFRL